MLSVREDFASLIPPLSPDEYAGLERSILEDGVREPIVTWRGWIVDGHNRYRIATAHGIQFETVERDFADDDAAKRWMIENQFSRRNLSAYQRSVLALELKEIIAARAKERMLAGKADPTPTLAEGKGETRDELAAIAGVSHGTLAKVERIERDASDELREQVKRGDVSINAAFKRIQKETAKAERDARKAYEPKPFDDDSCVLFVADIRDGLLEIEDDSIDAIITDPPYPREYIGLYADLANVATRILKPGGSLLAMAGQSYLPEVIGKMDRSGLDYHWTLSYLTPGGQAPHLFAKNVNTFWKPVIWYVKGKYSGDCIGDVVKSAVNDNDKRFHKWGQSESGIAELVERFTDPGQTILDPFLGGGTTGAVSLSMGRRFIGCDADEETLVIASERMRGRSA